MAYLPTLIIDRPLELFGWRELLLDRHIPLERLASCPCCEGECEKLVALISRESAQEVVVGRCRSCGWIGYRDRPSLPWLEQFYLSDWDASHRGARSKPQQEDESTAARKHAPSRNTQTLLSIVQNLDLD